MDLSPNQMLRLAPNKVDYLIPGGEMINEFLGEGPGARVCSQMWMASLVTSALQPGTATGLSRVAGTERLLRDCLAKNPAAWLGEAHAAHWGVSLGFLLKLLHSRDRLLLQTHPDGARARKYFGLPSGKDEAWYVLDTRPGACIWLGFRPGVTPAYFRELMERQDTAALLDCLHDPPSVRGRCTSSRRARPTPWGAIPWWPSCRSRWTSPCGRSTSARTAPACRWRACMAPPAWTACWTASILTACPGRSCWPGTGSAPPPGRKSPGGSGSSRGADPPLLYG